MAEIAMLLFWLVILGFLASSMDIAPTTSNSTGDYYIASSNNFKYGSISCNSLNCYIQCNDYQTCQGLSINNLYHGSFITIECSGDSSCYYGIFNVEKSNTFKLNCPNKLSCAGVKLIASETIFGSVDCDGVQSCKLATFDIATVQNTNIICSNSANTDSSNAPCYSTIFDASKSTNIVAKCGSYDCEYTKFYVNNSQNANFQMNGPNSNDIYGSLISQSLTVSCFEKSGCVGTNVECPINTYCNIHCMDTDSCVADYNYHQTKSLTISIVDDIPAKQWKYLNFTSYAATNGLLLYCSTFNIDTKLNYQLSNDDWLCGNSYCCPYRNGNIQCPSNSSSAECIIDCYDKNCENKNIHGMDANSLTLRCHDMYSCEGASVFCPGNDHSSCQVICSEQHSCSYMFINITTSIMDTLNVTCTQYNACGAMILSTTDVDEINSVSFLCINDGSSCYNSYIDFSGVAVITNVLHIKCAACQETQIIAPHGAVSTFNLECGIFGCQTQRGFDISAQPIIVKNAVNLQCIDNRACYTIFHWMLVGDGVNINIICNNPSISAHNYEAACYYTIFIIDSAENIHNNNNNVSISCNQYDCYLAHVNFTDVNQIEMECFAPYSCQKASISVTKANELHIGCFNDFSCEYMYVDCRSFESNDDCLVTCAAADSSCYGIMIDYPISITPTKTPFMGSTPPHSSVTPSISSEASTSMTPSPTRMPTTSYDASSTRIPTTSSATSLSSSFNGQIMLMVIGIIAVIVIFAVLVFIYMAYKKRKQDNDRYSEVIIPMTETIK